MVNEVTSRKREAESEMSPIRELSGPASWAWAAPAAASRNNARTGQRGLLIPPILHQRAGKFKRAHSRAPRFQKTVILNKVKNLTLLLRPRHVKLVSRSPRLPDSAFCLLSYLSHLHNPYRCTAFPLRPEEVNPGSEVRPDPVAPIGSDPTTGDVVERKPLGFMAWNPGKGGEGVR